MADHFIPQLLMITAHLTGFNEHYKNNDDDDSDDDDCGIDVMNVSVYFHSGLNLWRNSSYVASIYMVLPVCSPTPEPGLQRKMTFW